LRPHPSRVDTVGDVVKLVVPGSLPFLLFTCTIATILLLAGPGARRVGRWLVVVSVLLHLALSMPVVASAVRWPLTRGYAPITGPLEEAGAPVVIVFGNGVYLHDEPNRTVHRMKRETAENVAEAERLFRLLSPAAIIVSGGGGEPGRKRPESHVMRDALVERGVPRRLIAVEDRSRDTFEQVSHVKPLVERIVGDRPLIVITAAPHMRRVLALFHRAGLNPIPSIPLTSFEHRRQDPPVGSREALWRSESAIYEYLAIAEYWIRGRI
jgi:uncharacterized SAM-binding protein YcdF (DUF218 family)